MTDPARGTPGRLRWHLDHHPGGSSLPSITIESTGGDDTALINATIAAADPGTSIYLPDPIYLVTNLVVDVDNIMLVGNTGQERSLSGATRLEKTGAATGPIVKFSANGGGLRNLVIDGNAVAGVIGIQFSGATSQTLDSFAITDCATAGIDFTGANSQIRIDGFEIIAVSGTGIRINGNTYSVMMRRWAIVITTAGIGVDVISCDDVWFDDWSILCQNVLGTHIQFTGGDFGTTAATSTIWGRGYMNTTAAGNPRVVRVVGDTFDVLPWGHLFLGLSTIDGFMTWTLDKGAPGVPRYVDIEGRHNLRLDARHASYANDDFLTGQLTDGTIGAFGWNLNQVDSLTVLNTALNHPGIRRLDTSASATTNTTLFHANGVAPGESFECEYIFRLNQADTDTMCRIGLADSIADPPTNGIYLEKLYANTNWFVVCRATTQTKTDTGIAVTAGSWVRLLIRKHNNESIGFSLNDVDRINTNDSKRIALNIPLLVGPLFAIRNQAAASKTLDIDFYGQWIGGLDR